ncbi:MAG TPA: IclR family transcriptional regulator [Bryobacteraceae bacterium]|nr:IclR family transcriptional regulator [Bryobacteraceae bacterium]
MPADKTPSVPALERGLAILEVVAKSRSGLTFSQIARQLDFPKSSIHCMLLTFERAGYLRRSDTTGRYMCGLKLAHIANSALQGVVLREKAGPVLKGLLDRTGLTVHMAILESGSATLIAKVERIGSHKVATWVGKRIDVHCTSLGKCLIAYIPEAELDRLVQQHGLLRHNENTISSLPRLKQELAKIRQAGWALDDEEEEIGIRCIGAPVLGTDGRALAAISVSGTTEEIHIGTMTALAHEVRQAALELSRELGSYSEMPFRADAEGVGATAG